ncbi:DUF998 domain-containing protein [Leifsonia sp. 71-9]|mgnify:CR=1 FL=1|uniref:DUF998 domain-containing protein n=1 Tax=Leifsonia sp. 71-9 TaxID=1895934 RepID=UPI000929C4DB|nr:DUF998 domain-containing protein [Leifsonia sp. 71-9]OJX73004.1 MAG: hypothetical protein BGO91_14720 [Leifsonia sp. 71-9]
MSRTLPGDSSTSRVDCTPEARVTKSLLGYGVLAGPFYVVCSVVQGLLTPGFSFATDSWSLLSLGAAGWIHIAVFVLTGLMTAAAAIGYRRHLPSGPGRTAWAYLLIYGVLLVAAGAALPDAAGSGFSVHGMLHLLAGGLGFVAFAVWSFAMARRLRAGSAGAGSTGAAAAGIVVGALLLVGFVAIAASGGSAVATIVLTVVVILAWAWLARVSVWMYREAAAAGRIVVPAAG